MKNSPFYIGSILVFVILKWSFTIAETDHLKFLLKPVDWFVGMALNSNSVYDAQSGYFHEKLAIVIGKSCSGFNFWLIGFVLLNYLFIQHTSGTFQKVIALPKSLFLAYCLTVFANTSRILASIIIQAQTNKQFPNHQHLIHESIGIFTNLSLLILAYFLLTNFYLKKRHEKFA